MELKWGKYTVTDEDAWMSERAYWLLLLTRACPGIDVTKLTPEDNEVLRQEYWANKLPSEKLASFLDALQHVVMVASYRPNNTHNAGFNTGVNLNAERPSGDPVLLVDGKDVLTVVDRLAIIEKLVGTRLSTSW